jgi:hypothetical protein
MSIWVAPRKRVAYGLAARRLGDTEFVQLMDTKTGKKMMLTGDEWRDWIDAIKAGAGDDIIPLDNDNLGTVVRYEVREGDPMLHTTVPQDVLEKLQ